MKDARRKFLSAAGRMALAGPALGLPGRPLFAAETPRATMAVPGPGNLLFLPITLAARIGADRQEGIAFDIRYVGGGPQAFKDMHDRNVDFAAGGLSAVALQRLGGYPIVSIVPTTRVPAYTLLVRMNLKDRVRTIADLAGRVVGVKGHTRGGRSTSQLFTEFVLARAGVSADRVNYVSVGQAYDSQHAALASGAVDAIMGDEPFATRLAKTRVAYVLGDYHDLATVRQLLGGLFLNGQVATRPDLIDRRPEVVGRVVRALKSTLAWIDGHSAREMVGSLGFSDAEERNALLDALSARKDVYSPDGRFSAGQIATVERFFRATEKSPAAKDFVMASVVDDRWAGRSP